MPPQIVAIWAGAAGAAVVAAGTVAVYVLHPDALWPATVPVAVSERAPPPQPAQEQAKAPIIAALIPPVAPAPVLIKPAFDVVNVEPTGEAVVAGRAAPNAKVELRDAGKTVAVATADSAGEFVIIPPALVPGGHSLSLATGESPAETSNAIPVAVPEQPPKEVAAAEPAVKSVPVPPSPTSAGPAPPSAKIAVQSVEASAGGRLVAKGAAQPNATVRLYLSGAFVGDAKTGGDGRWSLTIEHGMTAGAYELRADEVNPATAAVVARADAPFEFPVSPQATAAPPVSVVASADDRAAATVGSPADLVVESVQTHHVERGHTLWGISQKYYGDGSRYQVIFAANTNQIRNPNLIYPGQLFVVPKPEPKP